MTTFICLFADFLIRYLRSAKAEALSTKTKLFFGFLITSITLTLVRCAFRLAELNQGYSGTLVKEEGLFIGLEGV